MTVVAEITGEKTGSKYRIVLDVDEVGLTTHFVEVQNEETGSWFRRGWSDSRRPAELMIERRENVLTEK